KRQSRSNPPRLSSLRSRSTRSSPPTRRRRWSAGPEPGDRLTAYADRAPRPLEGEPHARRYDVGVVRAPTRVHTVEQLGRVERMAHLEVRALQIERGIRRKSPRQAEIHLGADVAGIALHPALIVDRLPGREVCLGS